MKKLLETLRAARSIEVGLIMIALAALALLWMNAQSSPTDAAATDAERRLAHLLEQIDGVGHVSAMISLDEEGAVTGAVIVASDLNDVLTGLEIQSAVQALLGVEADRIRVIPGRNGRGGVFG